ncbi:MAG: YraN family protein [Sphingopyxis sp.]
MTRKRSKSEERGRRAETIAAWYLRLKGWRIVTRRARVASGEVDLIARRGRTLAFVEVKWRSSAQALDSAIDAHRLHRVAAAAQVLAPRYAQRGDVTRIDVILLAPGRWPRHLANIWMG